MAKRASELAAILASLEADELLLLSSVGPDIEDTDHAAYLLDGHHTDLRALAAWCSRATAADRRWAEVGMLRAFVQRLDAILLEATGKPIDRTKTIARFIHCICGIADPKITEASITEAVKWTIAQRGGISPQKN